MQAFKIHIRDQQGSDVVHDALLVNDFAAVRRAQAMASPDDTVEVWRDGVCIFKHERLGQTAIGSIKPRLRA
jgi:hypothetical protein